jgi:hypothetical protein
MGAVPEPRKKAAAISADTTSTGLDFVIAVSPKVEAAAALPGRPVYLHKKQ